MQPAFGEVANAYRAVLGPQPIDHRHTVAHAPPISDGAGLAFLGRDRERARAKILSYAEAGADPRASLTAGFAAMDQGLARAGLALEDMERIEFMEAFAVTIAMFLRDCNVDRARVKVAGRQLRAGQVVEVVIGGAIERANEPAPAIEIVHADDHILVVNKPAGLVTAPTPESDRTRASR